MKLRIVWTCLAVLALACGVADANPVIQAGTVLNAASYTPRGLPGHGVAQSGTFIVKGTGLGACGTVVANVFPLTTSMGGTSIRVTVGGTSVDALMLYVVACRGGSLPDQLAAVLPPSTPVGDGTVTVTYNGVTSAPEPIKVVSAAFGIFTINQAGTGAGIFTDPSYAVNTLLNAADPDEVWVIWGTGGGAIAGCDEAAGGCLAKNLPYAVKIRVGTTEIDPIAAVRSGCCAGIDQIAFKVPRGLAGCSVPVTATVNGVPGNVVGMSIASAGRTCSDEAGFDAADLDRIKAKGSASVGSLLLDRTDISASFGGLSMSYTSDSGSGFFYRYELNQFLGSTMGTGSYLPPYGSCFVSYFQGDTPEIVDPVQPDCLDAGPALTVTGPKGAKQLAQTQGSCGYSATLGGGIPGMPGSTPLYLDPGQYTITNGSSCGAVGCFNATLNFPTPMVWTNRDAIDVVPRTQGLTVNWTGGGANDTMFILGNSMDSPDKSGAMFLCVERASAQAFTVPSYILSQLPPSSEDSGIPMGSLSLMDQPPYSANKFTAPALDFGWFSYATMSMKPVTYQ